MKITGIAKNVKAYVVYSILSVLLLCIFPIVFLYANNIEDVLFHEIVLPLTLYIFIGLLSLILFTILLHSIRKACIASTLFLFVCFNYALIEKGIFFLIPGAKYWHVLPCIICLVLYTIYVLSIKISSEMEMNIIKIEIIVFSILIMFNLLIATPKIIQNITSRSSEISINKNEFMDGDITDRPNIYWMIFDEYSNFNVLKKYFDYDNKPFADFLEKNKFTVSYDSTNDSYQSLTVLTNYIHLDYLVDDNVEYSERSAAIKNGYVFDLLEQYGYTINAICGASSFGLDSETVNESTSINGETFSQLIYTQTLLYPLFDGNMNSTAQIYLDAFQKLKDCAASNNTANLNFAYFVLPHQPFIFDAKGGKNSLKHADDWTNKEYYLNQLIYTTNCITNIVETIVSKDPSAIIIIQSDHSARLLQNEIGDLLIDEKDRCYFLNAIYYRGLPIEEIRSQSGVNTLRYIIGKLLNIDLPKVEVPNLAY